MSLPSATTLLVELDAMTHAQRCRRMVGLTRDHATDPGLPTLLDEIAQTSDYHQVLTLLDPGMLPQRLVAALDSPSPRVRQAAGRRLPLPATDPTHLTEHYLAASAVEQAGLRRRLSGELGRQVADQILARPISDQARARLLASASAPVTAALLEDLADLVPNVVRLARQHPQLVLDHLARQITDAPQPVRQHWWAWADPALPELAAHDPDRLLRLVEENPDEPLSTRMLRVLGSLLRRAPARVAALLTDPLRPWPQRLPRTLVRGLAQLSIDDRLRLARRAHPQQLVTLLRAMPPSQRGEVFTRLTAGQAADDRPDELLDVLPHVLRHAEAERLLARPAIADDPTRLMRAAGYLPYQQALPLLEPYRRSANPDERAQAYRELLRAAGRERRRDVWAAAMDLLDRLHNEQDPVRMAAAQGLAEAPISLSATGPLGPLDRFSQAVVSARDSSPTTMHLLQEHCWRAIRYAAEQDPARIGEHLVILDRLCGPDQTTWVPSLVALPRGAEDPIIAALLPRLRITAERGEFRLLLALVEALGKRAFAQPDLQQLLAQAIAAPADWLIRQALGFWLRDPANRGDRVAEVLRRDESTATLEPVQEALLGVRQDLLDILWQPKPLRGRFWRQKIPYVPLLHSGTATWLPRQVEAYGAALARLATSRGTSTWEAAAAIRRLGQLPGIGVEPLQVFLDSPDVAQQEAALAALACSDDSAAAVDRLLSHRGDDRARVAVYALARCLRFLRPAELLSPLRTLLGPGSTVTSLKEGVRLLGSARPPGALDLLLDAVGTDSHRDVRIALARTLRGFLDDDRAWDRLAELTQTREEAWALTETRPCQLARRHRARYAEVVLAAARTTPELLGRAGAWLAIQPKLIEPLTARVLDAGAGAWQPCVDGLVTGIAHAVGWPETLALAEQLAARALGPDQPDATDREDLPLLRRLETLTSHLLHLPDDRLRPYWRQLAERLSRYPAFGPWLPAAAVAAINPADPTPGALQVARLAPDPLLAAHLHEVISDASHLARADLEQLGMAADAVLGDDPVSAVVALTLVEIGGERTGWQEAWRVRLRRLRHFPVPAVAGWAREVETST